MRAGLRRRAYPHMLLTGSLNDPRTGYWEPAKFVAKMRANKLGDRLLLLKVGRAPRCTLVPHERCFSLHTCHKPGQCYRTGPSECN